MKTHYDIAIVGAGLIGAALALRLAAETSLSIAVFERAPPLSKSPSPNLRVVALGATASEILTQCGVLDSLGEPYCHPYQAMHVWDEFSSGRLDFRAAEFDLPRLGYMIDSAQCSLLLQQKLQEASSIDAFFETQLARVTFTREQACLEVMHDSDERGMAQVSAELVIAADGPSSWVRQQAKIFTNHHDYEQVGIVALIETEKPHQDTAWQRFLEHGPIAILPVKDKQSSIVWSADNERAERLMAMPKADFEKALAQALEFKLGDVSLLSERMSFPLRSQKAERYVSRHLALIGDAAHSIHPLAGQGANLGFKDIQCLVEVLAKSDKHSLGNLSVLQPYQSQRQSDNEQTDRAMSALYKAFGRHVTPWLVARGIGMNIISQSTRLKKLLVEQAIGS